MWLAFGTAVRRCYFLGHLFQESVTAVLTLRLKNREDGNSRGQISTPAVGSPATCTGTSGAEATGSRNLRRVGVRTR
jgi:hypothetical protein